MLGLDIKSFGWKVHSLSSSSSLRTCCSLRICCFKRLFSISTLYSKSKWLGDYFSCLLLYSLIVCSPPPEEVSYLPLSSRCLFWANSTEYSFSSGLKEKVITWAWLRLFCRDLAPLSSADYSFWASPLLRKLTTDLWRECLPLSEGVLEVYGRLRISSCWLLSLYGDAIGFAAYTARSLLSMHIALFSECLFLEDEDSVSRAISSYYIRYCYQRISEAFDPLKEAGSCSHYS